MTEGVQTHRIDGIGVRVFAPEKTLADCFKFRSRIGKDIAVEALRVYWRRGRADLEAILRFAEIDRVSRVMRPYLESIVREVAAFLRPVAEALSAGVLFDGDWAPGGPWS